jgi:hypothetical protein
MKENNFSQFFNVLKVKIFENTERGISTSTKTSKQVNIVLQSTITCPNCGHQKEETMPTDACQYFYECENCKRVLKPNQGDCCVYCSFGTVKCPPIQAGDKSCCS